MRLLGRSHAGAPEEVRSPDCLRLSSRTGRATAIRRSERESELRESAGSRGRAFVR
jgi:hypothetical protein